MPVDILIFVGTLAFMGAGYYILVLGKQRRDMRKRIGRLKDRKVTPIKISAGPSLRRKVKEDKNWVKLLTKPLPDMNVLTDRLERAGFKVTSRQFILRCAMIGGATFVIIAGVLGKSPLLAFFAAIIIGLWIPFKVVDFAINKHAKAFLNLFPNAIDLIVRGLRSGLPVAESINLVAKEVEDPVGSIFSNIASTMKLGVPMEKALLETARRLNMTEFNFFTTSIILQRETGGNLGEILNNLSEVLRSRFMMRMKIKAMSSEAKASAMIVGALPFVVTGAISIMSPDYIMVLFNDYRGNYALAIAGGMMGTGIMVMRRMVRFEI